MEIKEIKKEVVAEVQYIAMDGTVFKDKEECRKYEESAFFVVKQKLKRLSKYEDLNMYEICDEFTDREVEIFQIDTEEDLKILTQYVYLKAQRFTSVSEMIMSDLTCGHEIILFWNYDHDMCWSYGDGSLKAFLSYIEESFQAFMKGNYKMRYYKKGGVGKGNLEREEYFKTKEDMQKKFDEVFVYEDYSLNPTMWERTNGEWVRVKED